MGMPEIIVDFKTKASTLVSRSTRGITLLMLNDATDETITSVTYTDPDDARLSTDHWTQDNLDYIKLALLGKPSKVICVRYSSEQQDRKFADALDDMLHIRFHYCAAPGATADNQSLLCAFIRGQRSSIRRTVKAVTTAAANDAGLILFTTETISAPSIRQTPFSASEYTARIAGILAGLSVDRSATFYVLDEVESVEEKAIPDENVDNGELILTCDGEKVKIVRAVNSKTTIAADEKAEIKKIKIVDAMDMIRDDIRTTIADNYVGKVTNTYANKAAFCAAICGYFKDLVKEGVLYDKYDNRVEIDLAAQEAYLKAHDTDTSAMTEEEIKTAGTGSYVFLTGKVMFADAMEDLTLSIVM